MKKQSAGVISKRVLTLTLAAFLLLGSRQNIYALPSDPSARSVQIVYQGLQDKKLVFNVNYENESSQPFQLLVKNEENLVLYFKEYEAKPLNTRMLFTDIPENGKLTFIIRTGKKEVAQAFEINTQVKTVEEFIVKGI
jgi:hypothetical protein